MNRKTFVLACAIVVVCISAAPVLLFAQSGADAGTMTFSLGDVCQVVGGAVTLGFGLWHFAVPGIYGWQPYVPEAPQSLVDAVAATNFFMSFSLSMVGASNIVMPLLADSATPQGRYWLWANVGLWTARAVYQLVKPQGSHDPVLQWGMTGAFVLTDMRRIGQAVWRNWQALWPRDGYDPSMSRSNPLIAGIQGGQAAAPCIRTSDS